MALPPFPPPQNGIKLAVDIISTDFGNLVAKVCECLLRRGCLTRAQISKFSDLAVDKINKCLWVLIQHNCVQGFALEQEGGGNTTVVTQYMALFNNIIHRLRFAKFINAVSEELDKEGLEILEGLLQHGRLTLPQVLDRAMETSDEGTSATRDTYNESFTKLVHSRFVERCPAAEPFLSLPNEEETSSKQPRPRGRKFAKREVTLEERALAAAIPMDAERFSISSELAVDSDDEKQFSDILSAKVGEKRKQDSRELASEIDLLGAKGEPVWRVNFEEFINLLRKKACVEYAGTAYDNTAAAILKAILKGTKSSEDTVSLPLESIFEEVGKCEEGHTMNLDLVGCALDQLHFCSAVDDVYSINLKEIIDKAGLEEVESLVLKRYGYKAFRIFRSLSAGRPMHTDQIAEKTLTDKKEAPGILYRFWQDGFLQMEKVSSGGQKYTDFIFWSVKTDKIWRKVLDELYHAALNLNLRSAHELESNHEINNACKAGGELPAGLKDKRRRIQQVFIVLNASLMELDDAIMLFSDFRR